MAGPAEVRGGGEPSGGPRLLRERGCGRAPCDVFPVHLRQRLAQEMPVGMGLVASLCLGDQSVAQASRFGEKGSRQAPRNHNQPIYQTRMLESGCACGGKKKCQSEDFLYLIFYFIDKYILNIHREIQT